MSLDDDHLDFNKIQNELDAAVEADQRYYRENDAKFRAVHQKVATYDEFRDIVLASHIKPLEKGDRISECKMTQPWNATAANKPVNTKTGDINLPDSKADTVTEIKIPSSSGEFSKHWRQKCKTVYDKCGYVLAIGGNRLKDVFHAEISNGLLGDILQALTVHDSSRTKEVVDILDCLTKVKRFSLSVQFLSSKEQTACKALFVNLRKEYSNHEHDLVKLKDLEKLYGVFDK